MGSFPAIKLYKRVEYLRLEQQAVLSLCNWKHPDRDRLSALLDGKGRRKGGEKELDLPWVLGQVLWGRAGGMAYLALEKTGLLMKVNREFRNTLTSVYTANRIRNESFQMALAGLAGTLRQADFPYALLKGAYLSQLYPSGLRTSNDIDILVAPASLPALEKRLEEDGYIQGTYDKAQGKIIPASRRDRLLSRMNRGETIPFCKQTGLPMLPYLEIDLNFSLDYKAKQAHGSNAVENLLTAAYAGIATPAGPLYTLAPDDFLIHLCAHLYKEAAVYQWVEMGRDLSLYKFCDIDLMAADALRMGGAEALAAKIAGLGLRVPCAYALSRTERLFGTGDRAGEEWRRLLGLLRADPGEDAYEILDPASQTVYSCRMDFVDWMFCSDRLSALRAVERAG